MPADAHFSRCALRAAAAAVFGVTERIDAAIPAQHTSVGAASAFRKIDGHRQGIVPAPVVTLERLRLATGGERPSTHHTQENTNE
jgi:hypothetical protein